MPNILVKTNHPSLIPMLNQGRKPGYKLVPVELQDPFSDLAQNKEIHAVIVDCNLTNPVEIHRMKEIMDDEMFPIILISGPGNVITNEEAGMWIGNGVSDIFQLPMPVPIMGKRLGSHIQLYCVTQSLYGQVTDKLTGLHNRQAFYHFAKRMMDIGSEDNYTVILSDIENFKRINERFGEAVGDEVLKYVGRSLDKMNNENVLFARYGGDQFVGIIREPKSGVKFEASFLEEAMGRFYEEAPIPHFSVQFGIYEKVDKTLPVSILCDRAMMALKTIKHQYGHNVGVYTVQLQQKFNREQQILDSMEQAIIEKQFQVYYQPKHDVSTSKLVGAEALVRWNHPVYGFMPPSDFIPLFEKSGFIREMDKYVWQSVCADVKKAMNQGIPVVPISINASRKDFLDDELIKYINKTLEEMNLDSRLFHLELTETAYVEEEELVTPLLRKLRECGIKIELDDFGSGLSSLGSVARLPVDIIKLDINLVKNLQTQSVIVESVISLMHNLGYKVTAEGVENESQVGILKVIGCDNVQGYYYSKPLTNDGFCKYIVSYNT